MAVWFITGASAGLGEALAREALAAGHEVVAAARSLARLESALGDVVSGRLLLVELDVTDSVTIATSLAQATARFGRLDVVVNNAGRGFVGAIEEASDSETRAVMETNFFGALAVTRAVLPTLRAQRSGCIVMVSSFGGFTQPGAGSGIYGATKFALEGASEALRNEVRDLGVRVLVVEPGSFRTSFLEQGSMGVAAASIDDYAGFMDVARERTRAASGTQPGDPMRAAAAIVSVVDSGVDVFRLPLGEDALAAVRAKLEQVQGDVDRVTALGLRTAHQ